MLKQIILEESGLIFEVYLTPYGFATITFAQGIPFKYNFTVKLSKEDLKNMIDLLNKLAEKWKVKS